MLDLLYTSLSIDMSDEEIKECIQEMMPICIEKRQGFCLTISGYDNDRRELWQIPEAVKFMKKLCDIGFISLLEVSTTCPELMREEYKVDKIDRLPGFGSLEVWMCGTNRMENGANNIDRTTMTIFEEYLSFANNRASKIVKESPYRNGVKKHTINYRTQIPDGPIKHHGFNRKSK